MSLDDIMSHFDNADDTIKAKVTSLLQELPPTSILTLNELITTLSNGEEENQGGKLGIAGYTITKQYSNAYNIQKISHKLPLAQTTK